MSADFRLLRWHERDRQDYERLAAALERVRAIAARGRGEIVACVPAGPQEPSDADRARTLLAQRRARDVMAGPAADLFGEPGWDILLTLFIAFEDGRGLSAGEIAATIPLRPPVLARWLAVLEARGLIGGSVADGGSDVVARSTLTGDGLALVLRCVGTA
ncbi:hypothetical protein M9979_10155 [Sphingomonas sp. RP10(2022)]|uniref:HTH marR-type domain-containing protein n=1 Tax=Sphingomonas liriopis TaxID=2949094 RepID=A0A9X2HW15_9SPHN|nr:hypothetical protein [Sphingomonas liriopis]MCP3735231.1 hypothetical protein [Sphingomonas liriopis]